MDHHHKHHGEFEILRIFGSLGRKYTEKYQHKCNLLQTKNLENAYSLELQGNIKSNGLIIDDAGDITLDAAGADINFDVGGTNTDAVVMQSEKFLGGAKSPTTKDILSGVENAINAALNEAKTESKDVKALIIGTTHFVNAIVQRNKLAKTGLIRICLPSGGSILPFADWPKELVDSMNGNFQLVRGGFEMDGSGFGLGKRSQRYAMIVDDGVVSVLNIEAGPQLEVSSAESILKEM